MRTAILFLIDGLRPDALQAADTPTMDQLMASGISTLSAQTVMPSITLPCIASLILSAPPEEHGVTSNIWTAESAGPGIFEVVVEAGGRAASFYNWEQLRDLSRPGVLRAGVYLDNCHTPRGAGDRELAELAATYLQDHPTDFTFIYLGYTDVAGHDHGWMTTPYLQAVENADRCIATVLERLPDNDSLLVAVTSDHGGHETHHGTSLAEDMTTSVILCTSGASSDSTSAGGGSLNGMSILDITPTIATWMGLSPARSWRGRSHL
ncbi:MAG: alkaline phosphatase family protein [Anaerolineae bacterium]|nr:alkaline phosphatase family protein [Anaerolineae bacterium]